MYYGDGAVEPRYCRCGGVDRVADAKSQFLGSSVTHDYIIIYFKLSKFFRCIGSVGQYFREYLFPNLVWLTTT